jgi:hypothetical protein
VDYNKLIRIAGKYSNEPLELLHTVLAEIGLKHSDAYIVACMRNYSTKAPKKIIFADLPLCESFDELMTEAIELFKKNRPYEYEVFFFATASGKKQTLKKYALTLRKLNNIVIFAKYEINSIHQRISV